jgi:hypothetical protein
MCGSTCSGGLHAHHQEITTALAVSGLPLERGGSSAVGRGLAGYNRPDHDQQPCYHHAPTVKSEAVAAADGPLMMGIRMPETC